MQIIDNCFWQNIASQYLTPLNSNKSCPPSWRDSTLNRSHSRQQIGNAVEHNSQHLFCLVCNILAKGYLSEPGFTRKEHMTHSLFNDQCHRARHHPRHSCQLLS